MYEPRKAKAKMCVVCGKRFLSKWSNRRYCSNRCRQEAYRKRLMKRQHPEIGQPNMIKVNGVLMTREAFYNG